MTNPSGGMPMHAQTTSRDTLKRRGGPTGGYRRRLTGIVTTVAGATLVLSGCGNSVDATVDGATGVSVNPDGSPTIVVAPCKYPVDAVKVMFDRKGLSGDESNKSVGTWKLKEPADSLVTLDLAAPDGTWMPHRATTLDPDRGYIVSAYAADKDSETSQVDFTFDQLKDVTPATVLHGGTVTSLESFQKEACRKAP